MEKKYTIKQVSEATGLSTSNIRYYEQEGLIAGIGRNSANVRLFSQTDVEWIRFLARLKDMEMPVKLMKRYAILRAQGNGTVHERMELLDTHKKHMLEKIGRIRENIALLDHKILLYKEMGKNNNG